MNRFKALALIGMVLLAASGRADTNDLSFEIHFDPQKTKLQNGTNYFGIDYLLINNGQRPLGRVAVAITIYTIDSAGRTKEIYPPKDITDWGSFNRPPLLQKGENWNGVAWVPECQFEGVKVDDKLVAKTMLYYNTNYQSVEYMQEFRVYSPAIPIGKIDIRKRENASTNARP